LEPLDPAPEEELLVPPEPEPGPPDPAPEPAPPAPESSPEAPDPDPAGVPEEFPAGAPEPPLEDGAVPPLLVELGVAVGVDAAPELEDPVVGAGFEPDELSPGPDDGVSDVFEPEQAISGPMSVNTGSIERRCLLVAIIVLAFRVVRLRAQRRSVSLLSRCLPSGRASQGDIAVSQRRVYWQAGVQRPH
jgi:hypothetical protein